MIIMGLDIATHLGVAVWCEGVIVHREVLFYPGDSTAKANHPSRFVRYGKYAAAIEDLLAQWAITHCYVEGYGYANKFTLAMLVELGTAVRQVLHESDARWYEVPPGTLKKFLTGNGTCKKDQIVLAVYKRFGIECRSDDEADAVALAYFGAAHQGQPVSLPEAQLKVARQDLTNAKKKRKLSS